MAKVNQPLPFTEAAGDAAATTALSALVPTNTRRIYDKAWDAFEAFCDDREWRALPASPMFAVEFILAERKRGAKFTRLKQLRAAIRRKHRNAGHADPCKGGAFIDAWKLILKDPDVHEQTPTLAVLFDGLSAIMETMAAEDRAMRGPRADPDATPARRLALSRDRALILALFFGAMLRSEVVDMSVEETAFLTDEVRTRVRASTFMEAREVVLEARRDPLLCPVSALNTWRREAEIAEGPIFRGIDQYGHIGTGRLDAKSVYAIWKLRAGRAGLSVNLFPVRALREGAIVEASLEGKQTKEIVEALGLSHIAIPLLDTRIDRAKKEIRRGGKGLFA